MGREEQEEGSSLSSVRRNFISDIMQNFDSFIATKCCFGIIFGRIIWHGEKHKVQKKDENIFSSRSG